MSPVYFAHPDAPAQRKHIARLRHDAVITAGICRFWDEDDYAARIRPDRPAVLVGSPDWICGPVWARVMADHVPDVRTHVFGESGHVPQYEQPEAFVFVMGAWLAETA